VIEAEGRSPLHNPAASLRPVNRITPLPNPRTPTHHYNLATPGASALPAAPTEEGSVEGHNYKTAAAELGVTVHAVSFHLRSVYGKLQVHSKTEAVAKALRDRLV
jgi:hypothetical protein